MFHVFLDINFSQMPISKLPRKPNMYREEISKENPPHFKRGSNETNESILRKVKHHDLIFTVEAPQTFLLLIFCNQNEQAL